MLTSFGSGEIWKGSNQEISVVLVPRCYKVEGEITDVVLNFYTTAGGTSIEFSGDTVTVSGINATVVFQPVQLDALDDGLIRYNVAFNEGGESQVFDLETRYILKTPNDYEPVDYVTHAEVEGVVDELLVEKLEYYYTSGETNEAISNAMAAETARTESTYLKEHQSLVDYYTSAQTNSAITNAINTESARTDTAISNAIAAETARTEQTYLKEHQSLADYWTSAQTQSAITEATSGISVPIATQNTLGVIKVGSGLTIDSDGTLSASGGAGGEYSEVINLYGISQQEGAEIYAYILANTGKTFTFVTKDGNDPSKTEKITTTSYYYNSSWPEIYFTWYFQEGGSVPKFKMTSLKQQGQYNDNVVTKLLVEWNQKASANNLGLVKVGSGLTIDSDGILSVSGGTDLSDYWTSAQTQSAITNAIDTESARTDTAIADAIAAETARTESTYLKEHQSLADYYTSAQTDTAIQNAISGIDLGDYYTSAQTDNKIAEAVSAVTFSGVTQPILDATMAAETARTEQTYLKQGALADYYTSGETNEVISNAIAAETARTESTYLKEHQSLDNYYTKAQTESAITNAIDTESARTNTAIANAIAAETARTEQTYLKQGALADYYTSGQTNTAISNAVSEKVSSLTITQIWTGSQQAYDAMTEHSANILYIINS